MPPGGSLGGSGVFDTLGPQGAPLDLPEVEYSRIPYFDPLNRPDGTYDYIGNAEAPTTLGTRLDGVLRLGAGIVEGLGAIGLLLAPEPTAATKALGVGAGAVALDNLWAGAWQIWTGQYQETLLRQSAEAALSAAGASEDAARIGATLTDLGANTVAAGAASAGVSNLAKLSRAKRAGEAARIPVEGDPDFIGPPRPPAASSNVKHPFGIRTLGAAEAKLPSLPSNARTAGIDEIYRRLQEYHGIDAATASERLHLGKQALGYGASDNLLFDLTGNVFDPVTREWLFSLTRP